MLEKWCTSVSVRDCGFFFILRLLARVMDDADDDDDACCTCFDVLLWKGRG